MVLGNPASHSFSPHSKTRRQRVLSHEIDDLCLCQPKLEMDGLKGSSVFPSHLNNSVFFYFREHDVKVYSKTFNKKLPNGFGDLCSFF
jgi:hypothetical protein